MSLLDADGVAVHDGATPLVAPLSLRLEPGEPLIVLSARSVTRSVTSPASPAPRQDGSTPCSNASGSRSSCWIGDRTRCPAGSCNG